MTILSELSKEWKDGLRVNYHHKLKRGAINRQFGVLVFYKKLDKCVISESFQTFFGV